MGLLSLSASVFKLPPLIVQPCATRLITICNVAVQSHCRNMNGTSCAGGPARSVVELEVCIVQGTSFMGGLNVQHCLPCPALACKTASPFPSFCIASQLQHLYSNGTGFVDFKVRILDLQFPQVNRLFSPKAMLLEAEHTVFLIEKRLRQNSCMRGCISIFQYVPIGHRPAA